MRLFHSSLELGQHGDKGLEGCLKFGKKVGCEGVQPSNYLLQRPDGSLMSAPEIRSLFDSHELKIDGISAHCMFWAHGTAHTGSPTIRPFLPAHLHGASVEEIEEWTEAYLIELMNLSSELGNKVLPMFWGVYQGWELATGYPWGFGKGPGYDLQQAANERFVQKTARLRAHANSLGIRLAHEVHANSGAICADDFLNLVKITDNDPCLGVFADPSHCWEGEDVETRFTKLAPYIWGAHAKDFVIVRNRSLRMQTGNWKQRGVHFTLLGQGEVDLQRYIELLIDSGLPQRWNALHGVTGKTVPICAEAESAHVALDDAAADGVRFVRDVLCREIATQSFEDGMGAA